MIRNGIEVHVVDYATGEDLTAFTLTQIISEQEKKNAGFLPRPLLTGLVKAGGDTIESVRRTLIKPLDLSIHVEEEIARRIDILVAKNELTEDEGHQIKEKMVALGGQKQNTPSVFDRILQKYIEEQGLPSKSDYQKLLEQLEILTQKVEELSRETKPPDDL